MCCVDDEPDNVDTETSRRSGGIQQAPMNETMTKVRQTL